MICLSFPALESFGSALAKRLGAGHATIDIHRFPDEETRIRLGADCAGKRVILVGGGRDPNPQALPLHFAAHAARDMGAKSVGLAAGYLPYMRQDRQFAAREAVSARAYADFLSHAFDWLATVDPHLHRIHALDEVFTIPAVRVSSMPAVAAWIGRNVPDAIVVGPDEESRQWVESVAQRLGFPWTTLNKHRTDDRQVTVSVPDPDLLRGRSPVILDDIASSGHTLAEAARALRSAGSAPVTCIVVHALIGEGDETALRACGIDRLVSTNTIPHHTNAIDVIPLLAEAVQELAGRDFSRTSSLRS